MTEMHFVRNDFGTIYVLCKVNPEVLFLKNLTYRTNAEASHANKSDKELIQLYKESKKQQIIGVLFDRYIHMVFASCMKYLKNEDDAQDAAMVIFESLSEKLIQHEVEYFKSWLYTTTRNHCLMQLRKKNIIDRIDNFEKIAGNSVESEDVLHLNEKEETGETEIKRCLNLLKEEQRICVELMYIEGLSYNDIAVQTGYNLKKVKSYIQNGKRNLKQQLEAYYDRQNK